MSSNYQTILQIWATADHGELDRAYRLSVLRYERLTSAGPLRFYRNRLLADVERAYESLRKSLLNRKADPGTADHSSEKNKPSLLARQAAAQQQIPWEKPAIRSDIREGSILAGEQVKIRGREIEYLRKNGRVDPEATTRAGRFSFATVQQFEKSQGRARDLIEDDFCLEVLYRLEGDLIRFDSRRELLQIARQWQIDTFRANMLMAQIVEAVRQHKLYEPRAAEKPAPQKTTKSRKGLIIGAAITLAIILDVLLIRLLGK